MSRDGLYLVEIVQACGFVAQFLPDVDVQAWADSELIRSAVLQKLIVVGEAASGLSPELRAAHPEVPWQGVRAFRNVAVHQYFAVDWPQVWAIATRDVPALREQVRAVLQQVDPELARRAEQRAP